MIICSLKIVNAMNDTVGLSAAQLEVCQDFLFLLTELESDGLSWPHTTSWLKKPASSLQEQNEMECSRTSDDELLSCRSMKQTVRWATRAVGRLSPKRPSHHASILFLRIHFSLEFSSFASFARLT